MGFPDGDHWHWSQTVATTQLHGMQVRTQKLQASNQWKYTITLQAVSCLTLLQALSYAANYKQRICPLLDSVLCANT